MKFASKLFVIVGLVFAFLGSTTEAVAHNVYHVDRGEYGYRGGRGVGAALAVLGAAVVVDAVVSATTYPRYPEPVYQYPTQYVEPAPAYYTQPAVPQYQQPVYRVQQSPVYYVQTAQPAPVQQPIVIVIDDRSHTAPTTVSHSKKTTPKKVSPEPCTK